MASPTSTEPAARRGPARARLQGLLRAQPQPRWSRKRVQRTRRDWVVDSFATVTVLLIGAISIHSTAQLDDLPPMWVRIYDAAVLPLMALALWWRRRWPLQVAAVLAVIGAITNAAGAAFVLAIFALGRYGSTRDAVLGIGMLLLTLPVALTVWPTPDGSTLTALIFSLIIAAGVGAWGMFAGARADLLVALRDRADRAEREQELQVAQARQQERARIAREMHDVLAHRMALLSLHAGALEYRPGASPEAVTRAAGVIRATAHEALEELRAVIGVLRVEDALRPADEDPGPGEQSMDQLPAPPEAPQPTLADVPGLIGDWQQAGARVAVTMTLGQVTADEVPATLGRTAYRIVQEGLTNAGKHAAGVRVEVDIVGEPGQELLVTVRNPRSVAGAAHTIPGTGMGLIGLRERAELVGGKLRCGEREDGSFELHAALPWTVTTAEVTG